MFSRDRLFLVTALALVLGSCGDSPSPPVTESETGRVVGQDVDVDGFEVEVTEGGTALFSVSGSVLSSCYEAMFAFEEPDAAGVMIGWAESWLDPSCTAGGGPVAFSESMEVTSLAAGNYIARLDDRFEVRFEIDNISVDCIPGEVDGAPIVEPDRRIGDIIFYLTGERQTGDEDPVEETIEDPNFGGVWGDFGNGIVVAVLDCSEVDAEEIARIAGGPEYLHLIEVPHTFRQVDELRDALAAELRSLDIPAELMIESTLTGRHITVQLPDPSQLPSGFGSSLPDDLFTVVQGELFRQE